jgi:hypothetical protein
MPEVPTTPSGPPPIPTQTTKSSPPPTIKTTTVRPVIPLSTNIKVTTTLTTLTTPPPNIIPIITPQMIIKKCDDGCNTLNF